MSANLFVINLLIAVLVYFLLHAVIDTLIHDPRAKEVFNIILLVACVLFALFGSFLPFIK